MSVANDSPHDPAEVQAFLEKSRLIKAGESISLIPYEPAFPRRQDSRRWHYRVESGNQPVCHLIVGLKLNRVKARADQFFSFCPTLICRPLAFWERSDGMGFLSLEHFAGESLEELVRQGRCTADEWLRVVRQVLNLLSNSSGLSTTAALHREIEDLTNSLSAFPEFSSLDTRLIRELAESVLLKQSVFEPLTTRWSNGDFIGRNLLVNPQGEIRLIDYEHAGPTHFWRSDWLRITQFSQLPPGLDVTKIEELSAVQQPWQRVQFWLHNLSQLSEAEPCEPVDRHVSSVTRELCKAIDLAFAKDGSPHTPSFLLKALARGESEYDHLRTTPRDERYRHRRMAEDLEQANYRVISLTRELARKENVIRDRSATDERAKAAIVSLTSEVNRLRVALRHAQDHIDCLLSEDAVSANPTVQPATKPGDAAGTLYSIDQKEALYAKNGELVLTGKIRKTAPGMKVRLRTDREDVFDCSLSELPASSPHEQMMGFALRTYVPAGLHLVTLEYHTEQSADWIVLARRSLIAEVSALLLRIETAIPPTKSPGECVIQGWCLHPQEKIKSLSVRHGPVTSVITWGMERPDVASSYPWNSQASHAGFAGSFKIQPGEDDVVLTAHLESGLVLQEVIARRVLVPDEILNAVNDALSRPLVEGVTTPPSFCPLNQTLYFGRNDTIRPFLESGWHAPEQGLRWAIGPRAGLRFRFKPTEFPTSMRITVVPLTVENKVERQRIHIDQPPKIAPEAVELSGSQPRELIFSLSQPATDTGELRVSFGFPDAVRPHDLGLSNDIRMLSVAFISLTFA